MERGMDIITLPARKSLKRTKDIVIENIEFCSIEHPILAVDNDKQRILDQTGGETKKRIILGERKNNNNDDNDSNTISV